MSQVKLCREDYSTPYLPLPITNYNIIMVTQVLKILNSQTLRVNTQCSIWF